VSAAVTWVNRIAAQKLVDTQRREKKVVLDENMPSSLHPWQYVAKEVYKMGEKHSLRNRVIRPYTGQGGEVRVYGGGHTYLFRRNA